MLLEKSFFCVKTVQKIMSVDIYHGLPILAVRIATDSDRTVMHKLIMQYSKRQSSKSNFILTSVYILHFTFSVM